MLSVEEQNEQLKRELSEAKEQLSGLQSAQTQSHEEVSALKAKVVNLQKNLDGEMGKREQMLVE